MAYRTRKGTLVLHPDASRAAANYEIYHDAPEYVVYRMIRDRSGEYFAEAPDHLLVLNIDEPNHPRLAGLCHVLNLVTGERKILSWDDLAHTAKPAEQRFPEACPTCGTVKYV